MALVFINGAAHELEDNKKLLPFLRERLRVTSVKDGCGEGACGACMVLVDGVAQRGCLLGGDKLHNKHVLTLEGLPEDEREVFAYAFKHAGAVQCGFCTPGMVISAKALLLKNPAPTRKDIKAAIRGNICRCTGYQKIEDAILLSADLLACRRHMRPQPHTGKLGESYPRIDAHDKILGKALYADDIHMEGMLFGAAKRSGYPRARVLSIDTARARALSGVATVLTARDIPGDATIGHLKKDWPVLVAPGAITHYVGDAVALVAATDRATLAQALSLIEVAYEVLPGVFSPEEAMADDAPQLHEGGNLLAQEHLMRGDANATIQSSKYVVCNHFSVPATEHAFLEPECAVAYMQGGALTVISADQGVYQTRRECADMLGLPQEDVRVCATMVGGGFGGKEDMSVQHHAALLAYKTGRPVKVKLTRQESITVHPKRHAMRMHFTTACDENGMLTAMKAEIISDSGAYASLGGPVLQRACTHAAGPYNYQVIDIVGKAYYTNNPPAGAFRGFGVTQSCFATETNLNQLAKLAGISPFEIRYRNAIRPGQVLPNGQIADASTALVETLDSVRPDYDRNPACGIACAIKNSGLGVGVPDVGRLRAQVRAGRVHLYSSAACIGQGLGTVLVQMFCEAADISPEMIIYHSPDTRLAPNAGNTTASRQTLFTGEAAIRAAVAFRAALHAAGDIAALEGQEYHGEFAGVTDKMGADKAHPVSHVAYSYATHLVELDDKGYIARVVAAHDVGRPVNPQMVEGQIEGGVVMSLGYALTESYPLQEGRPLAKYGALGLFRADKAPRIEARIIKKTGVDYTHMPAFGAKGVGEISSIPTPPAVALAYSQRDGLARTTLPLYNTPYAK
ncbi:MAG: selenium-dependent xanthine dehydrogenase [Clostridiales bacterium]|jgi:selenium-dependent xanthine dehydrogenase|nr:selenium-dependent xanthine dehydrogenase [Clostridiales bacterium]